MDNKILVALIKIGQQQASATEATNEAIEELLDYVTTYPNDGINYRSSNMVLAGHSDADYLNYSKACSRSGAHIMIYEDVPVPNINGPVLTISQVIKFVMSPTSEL